MLTQKHTLHWQYVINTSIFSSSINVLLATHSSPSAATQKNPIHGCQIVTLKEDMDFWISIHFILQLHLFPVSAIRVFSTSTDYQVWSRGGSNHTEGGFAGASLKPESLPDSFSSITLCWRFYEFAITNGYLVSSDLTRDEAKGETDLKNVYILKVDNSPRTDGVSKFLGILHQGQFYQTHWPPRRWHHVCISFEATTARIVIVSNGQKVYDFIDDDLINGDEHFPPETLKNLKIMSRSKDGHTGIFGMMTDVNIWDTALDQSTQVSWTECKDLRQGNLVAWENSTWELVNLFEENQDRAGLCTETDLGLTIVPLNRDFEGSQAICERLGGSPAVANNIDNLEEMASLISENKALCPNDRVYAGFTDLEEEGR